MVRAGVFGCPVIHSLSPELFNIFYNSNNRVKHKNYKTKHRYFRIHAHTSEDIKNCSNLLELDWFNITSPLKKKVLEICSKKEFSLSNTGVANLVVNRMNEKNSITRQAFNTDVFGIIWAIKNNFNTADFSSALVIGAGGAAHAAIQALKALNINISIYNRTIFKAKKIAVQNNIKMLETIDSFPDFDLIINTVPWDSFKRLVPYNATKIKGKRLNIMTAQYTILEELDQYIKAGHKVIDGSYWLTAQAQESYRLYDQHFNLTQTQKKNKIVYKKIDYNMIHNMDHNMDETFYKRATQLFKTKKSLDKLHYCSQKKIIFITGFSGTGKSLLLKNRKIKNYFQTFDLDDLIIKKEKAQISKIIEKKGLPFFRNLEKKILKEIISSLNNLQEGLSYAEHGQGTFRDNRPVIIALGGGTLIDLENQELLNKTIFQNEGACIWLLDDPFISSARAIKSLEKRPLLINNDESNSTLNRPENTIKKLWLERLTGYENTCSLIIPVFNKTPDEIMKMLFIEVAPQKKIILPPFKSSMIRLLFIAAFANGKSIIHCNKSHLSDDVTAMIKILNSLNFKKNLNIKITILEKHIIIQGDDIRKILITDNDLSYPLNLDCSESALCARIFKVLSCFSNRNIKITGKKSLTNRPVKIENSIKDAIESLKPLLTGSPSSEDNYKKITLTINKDSSSQYITGLLLICGALNRQKNIEFIINDPVSRPYLELTLKKMAQAHIKSKIIAVSDINSLPDNKSIITLYSGNAYKPITIQPMPDISGAVFLICSLILDACYADNYKTDQRVKNIHIKGLTKEILSSPDSFIFKLLEKSCYFFDDSGLNLNMATISIPDNALSESMNVSSFTVDCSVHPDIFMPLSILAAFIPGNCVFKNIKRLSTKETDRPKSISGLLDIARVKTSIYTNETGDLDMTIEGIKPDITDLEKINFNSLCNAGATNGLGDHRFVMALCTIFKTFFNKITLHESLKNRGLIDYTSCISKSFPGFIEILESL